MTRPRYRHQRTITRPAEVQGIGFVTGADVRLRFVPAPPWTGIIFLRTDLGPEATIPATVERVSGTNRRTTLGTPPVCVSLVEHVLAALAGLRIDNCYVEVNAPETPGLDGSARAFVEALNGAGIVTQPARHKVLDLIGDLALLGHDVRGHMVAYRSGHPLNVELVRALAARQVQTAAQAQYRQAA